MKQLIERLAKFVEALGIRRVAIAALEAVEIPELMLYQIEGFRRAIKVAMENPVDAKRERLQNAVDCAQRMLKHFDSLEWRFLNSLCAEEAMRGRIEKLSSLPTGSRKAIESVFAYYASLRRSEKRDRDTLYGAYTTLLDLVKKGEEWCASPALRIETTMTPSPSKSAPDRKSARRIRDQQIRLSMKGGDGGGKKKQKTA